jgi:hypothetical protein
MEKIAINFGPVLGFLQKFTGRQMVANNHLALQEVP